MNVIVPPSEYIRVEYSRLLVNGKSIKLTRFIGESTDTLYFGGHDFFCIDALVHKPGSKFVERGGDISDAFLSHLYYNMLCNLEGDFRKGIDSTMILNLCISYIKDTYPYIKTVSFTDTSYKTCDDGKIVELAEMQYVRTGKTWYETHFHAYIDPVDERKFNQCEKRFLISKQNMSWKDFKSYMMGPLPLEEEDLKDMFSSALTWQDFFASFSDKIGISMFCSFVSPWLHRFIETEMRFYFSSTRYYIPVHKIERILYDVKEYVRGGKRYTRKRSILEKMPKNLH